MRLLIGAAIAAGAYLHDLACAAAWPGLNEAIAADISRIAPALVTRE
jgi:hypothetical protein